MPITQQTEEQSLLLRSEEENLPHEDVVNLSFARKRVAASFDLEFDAATLPKRQPFVAATSQFEGCET